MSAHPLQNYRDLRAYQIQIMSIRDSSRAVDEEVLIPTDCMYAVFNPLRIFRHELSTARDKLID